MKRKADEKISGGEKADLEENEKREKIDEGKKADLEEDEKDEPISPGKNVNFWLNEMGVRQEATQEGTEKKKEWSGKEKWGWMG